MAGRTKNTTSPAPGRVVEIVDQAWLVEGRGGLGFPGGPQSGNSFVLRDQDVAVLLYADGRPEKIPRIMAILNRLIERGASELIVLPAGDWGAHPESGAGFRKVRVLVPGPGQASQANPPGPGRLEILDQESLLECGFGGLRCKGWPVGRFWALPEANGPGLVSLYDPQHKLMISGEATLETNPGAGRNSPAKCIEVCRRNFEMAGQGLILLASDRWRSSRHWPHALAERRLSPLSRPQMADAALGQEECEELYRGWLNYFTALKDETLLAHSRIGDATLEDIAEEMTKSSDPNVRFRMGLEEDPLAGLESLVVGVMQESRASRRVEGGRVLFSPKGKWKFAGGLDGR